MCILDLLFSLQFSQSLHRGCCILFCCPATNLHRLTVCSFHATFTHFNNSFWISSPHPERPYRLATDNGCLSVDITRVVPRGHRYLCIRDQPFRFKRWQFPYLPIEWFILFYYKVLLFLLIGIFILLYNDRYSMDLCSLTPSPVLRPSLSPRRAWRTGRMLGQIRARKGSQRKDWGYVIPIMA